MMKDEVVIKKERIAYSKSKIKYIIKPEEKVVIGIYVLSRPELLSEISSFNCVESNIIESIFLFSKRFEDVFNDKTIKAVARCHDDDEFNEDFGKKLVEANISKKRHEIIMRQSSRIMKILAELNSKCRILYHKHFKKHASIAADLRYYFKVNGSD